MYRLSSTLQKWLAVKDAAAAGLQPAAPLQYFELNTACRLVEQCKPVLTVQWQLDGEVLLNIPPINPVEDITAPVRTTAMQMHIMAVACRVSDATIQSVQEQTITYNYTSGNYPAQQLPFSLPVGNGILLLVAVAQRYRLQGMPEGYDSKIQWLPAAIIDGVFYSD